LECEKSGEKNKDEARTRRIFQKQKDRRVEKAIVYLTAYLYQTRLFAAVVPVTVRLKRASIKRS